MKIGILETGKPADSLIPEFGDYPAMFENLLGDLLPEASFFTVRVVRGEMPTAPDQADVWIITGSRHSAYENLPWVDALKEFLRQCMARKVPIVGICFGHQILAEAMGGKVEKSEKGWGVGVQDYAVENTPTWLTKLGAGFASHVVHQDQITRQPDDTTVIAASDFCSVAALLYGDPTQPDALTVQSHPELSAEFVGALGAERLPLVVPADVLETGLATLGKPVDNRDWAEAIAQFINLRLT